MWIVVILAYGDGVQGAVTGVLKVSADPGSWICNAEDVGQGCGQQATAANANIMAYWLCGLPLGFLLTYKIHNIAGLLAGQCNYAG